jgi:hypothetical protein
MAASNTINGIVVARLKFKKCFSDSRASSSRLTYNINE